MSAVDHAGLEQLEVGDISVLALKLAHLLDVLVLLHDERRGIVALAVDQGENRQAFFPAVLAREPTGGLGEEQETGEEDKGRDHLDAPGDTESGVALGEAAAI